MPEETRCWNDLQDDNTRLRAVNAKLVEAAKDLAEVAAAHIPEAHGPHPNPAYEPIERTRAAIAAAEGDA